MEHPVVRQVLTEQNQGAETRKALFSTIEGLLGRKVVAYFTSFKHPVMIDDDDADMLEGVLQKSNLERGLCLLVNSPGGDGLAAERIINLCRNYSKTKEFFAIVPNKAKSAGTLICMGASKIYMGPSSELGPVDPQIGFEEDGSYKRFSVCNIVDSYQDLFDRAVKADGNLEPYIQQLSKYDEREIKELKSAIELAEDISVRSLKTGAMKDLSDDQIKAKIKVFLTPERTKSHGRPIYQEEAKDCGLPIESMDVQSELWSAVYELYIRLNMYVTTRCMKCIESFEHNYASGMPKNVR
ncbi:hypothetical protein ACE5IS_19530 [Leptospira wolffii]|uniref:Serine dehydrogenase proteinase n=1 Tax=Leptospira wolffii TaxID=409998 RepID=A0ABV5BTN3_9LEPT